MDRFAICLAFQQLESDYNKSGILQERPSNQRRRGSIGVQLRRMKFECNVMWVDIESYGLPGIDFDSFEEEVALCYMKHVLLWNLPIDPELMEAIRRAFTPEYLQQFSQTEHHEWYPL